MEKLELVVYNDCQFYLGIVMAISVQRNHGGISVIYPPEPTWKTKILDCIQKIWEAIKNFFCCRTSKPLTDVQIAGAAAQQSWKEMQRVIAQTRTDSSMSEEQKNVAVRSALENTINKTDDFLQKTALEHFEGLRNEVAKHRTGVPLTETQKRALSEKRDLAEQFFQGAELNSRNIPPRAEPAPFHQYRTTGLQAEIQTLLNGQALSTV